MKNISKLSVKLLFSFIFLICVLSLFLISCKTEVPVVTNTDNSSSASSTISSGDKQIIEVTASRGYSPKNITAKAGVPTILVMKSEGAYGCERAFNIPDLNISKILPENGQTEFDLGTQAKGTKLVGVCSMGMYYFQIIFN
ncbi:MAG: cupredoxin domain-containing protein [Candidatus Humimicrobiaceae bacterium]